MKRLELQPIVKEILEKSLIARDDDFILIGMVYYKLHPTDYTFSYIAKHHKELKLPSFESITRARRKVQEEYPELINKEVKEIRTQEEIRYMCEYGN